MIRSEAYRDGHRGFREGEAQQENPHAELTPGWSDWRDGWRDAAAEHEDSKWREREPWPDDDA